jgi:hypothetical protein
VQRTCLRRGGGEPVQTAPRFHLTSRSACVASERMLGQKYFSANSQTVCAIRGGRAASRAPLLAVGVPNALAHQQNLPAAEEPTRIKRSPSSCLRFTGPNLREENQPLARAFRRCLWPSELTSPGELASPRRTPCDSGTKTPSYGRSCTGQPGDLVLCCTRARRFRPPAMETVHPQGAQAGRP